MVLLRKSKKIILFLLLFSYFICFPFYNRFTEAAEIVVIESETAQIMSYQYIDKMEYFDTFVRYHISYVDPMMTIDVPDFYATSEQWAVIKYRYVSGNNPGPFTFYYSPASQCYDVWGCTTPERVVYLGYPITDGNWHTLKVKLTHANWAGNNVGTIRWDIMNYPWDDLGNINEVIDIDYFKIVDSINEAPTITYPSSNGQVLDDPTPTFTWTSSNTFPQTAYRITGTGPNGETYDSGVVNTGAQSHTFPHLTNGNWNFEISTYNGSEWSWTPAYRKVTINAQPPTISNVTVPTYANGDFNVDILGVSDTSGISNVKVSARYNGGSWTWVDYPATNLGGGHWRATIKPSEKHGGGQGTYEIQVRATDIHGKVNETFALNPKTVIFDTDPPTFVGTITAPSQIDVGNGSYKVTVNGLADSLSGIEVVSFGTWTEHEHVDEAKWINSTVPIGSGTYEGTINLSIHGNQMGKYYTNVWVRDKAGNSAFVGQAVINVLPSYNAEVVSNTIPDELSPGQSLNVQVTLKNTGFRPWTKNDQIKLGAVGDSDPFSPVNRIELPEGITVNSGQEYTFTIPMIGPNIIGEYTTDWRMLKEGVMWFGETLTKTIGIYNNIPNLSVTSPTTMTAYTSIPNHTFEINGFVQDFDNDDVTIAVEVAGVTKSTTLTNTLVGATFSIEFNTVTDNLAAGEYTILITVKDEKGGIGTNSEHKVIIKQRMENGAYILVNTIVDEYPARIYSDTENDPMLKEQFRFEHLPTYFTNDMGSTINVDYIDIPTPNYMPYTTFGEVGQYKLFARAMDNPKDQSNFAEFRLWSDDTPNHYTFYVHRKPIAEFTVEVQPATGGYTVSFIDTSYDLDHMDIANKGIVNREWKYRKKGEILWTSGQPTGVLPSGGEYEVGLRVQDQDGSTGFGAWSDWTYRTFTATDSPKAGFEITPIEAPRGETFEITSTATEPNGLPLIYEYKLEDINGETVPSHSPNQNVFTTKDFSLVFHALQKKWKARDTYKITQTVTNTVGITATTSKTFSVVNQKPNVGNGAVNGQSLATTPSVDDGSPTFSWVYYDADYDVEQSYRLRIFTQDGALVQSTGIVNTSGITSGTAQNFTSTMELGDGTYTVWIEVHDGYEWSNIYKGTFKVNTNNAPIPGFIIHPNPIFEGDTAFITSTATDPDGDALTYQYWVQYQGSSTWELVSTSANWSKVFHRLGTHQIKQRVTDTKGLWAELTKSIIVNDLTVLGQVLHTEEWNNNRLKWNAKYDPDRPYSMFWAGEKFILNARTTNTGSSQTKANEVRVTANLGVTSINESLSTVDFINWYGESWKGSFQDIPDGIYTFTFTSIWKNKGVVTHTESDMVHIQIKDNFLLPLQLHQTK